MKLIRASSLLPLILLITAGARVPAQGRPKPSGKPSTGVIEMRFRERSPLSAVAAQSKRFGWTPEMIEENDPAGEYKIEEERFQALVPKSYTGKKPFGLFVWIHPGDEPWIHGEWPQVLERRDVIMIEALKAGNERFVWYRMGLALDAAHNMAKQYKINPDRVWVGGFSGGGRVAAAMGMAYADVFRGAYAMGGANHYLRVRHPSEPDKGWEAAFPRPPEQILALCKSKRRFVLMAGADDFNRAQTQAIHESLTKSEGFARVLYQEVPGVGHAPAGGTAFEEGLRYLDGESKEPKGKK